jgi:hypothetical protein
VGHLPSSGSPWVTMKPPVDAVMVSEYALALRF